MTERRARILLVDDRPQNLLALESILEPLEAEFERAGSGDEALRAVLQRDFAVILLDVQMPGMNGFETASRIKSRARSRHTPIIFLTAISKEERFVSEGYSVGAVDYMPKPLQPEILRSKVSVFIELWHKNEEIRRQADLLRESERRELELRHAAELRETEARAAQIVGAATEAIVTFDASRRVALFNAAAVEMFGIPPERAGSLVADDLLHPRGRADLIARVASLGASSRARSAGAELLPGLRGDGSEFPFEASLSRLDLAGGPVFALIGRDVTERVQAEEALRRQAAELEEAAGELRAINEELHQRQEELERAMTARSRFYASMSHELRTPINAILGYSELLLDRVYGEMNDRQAMGVERTRRAGRHLLELVNDVLDLSKIEAGKLELAFEPVTFPAIVEDLFVTVRPMADQRGCELTLRREGDGRTIVTDPRRVRQILLNLLGNALKFGAGKPVEVVYTPGDGDAVQVSVIDNGPGIPADEQNRIFEEFVQLRADAQVEGTGLGLPISRRLAVLLGGSITVASTVGEGSRFTLTLPSAASQLESGPDATVAAAPQEAAMTTSQGVVDSAARDAAAAAHSGSEERTETAAALTNPPTSETERRADRRAPVVVLPATVGATPGIDIAEPAA